MDENWLKEWLEESSIYENSLEAIVNEKLNAEEDFVKQLMVSTHAAPSNSIKMTELSDYFTRVHSKQRQVQDLIDEKVSSAEEEDLLFDREFRTGKRKSGGGRGNRRKRDFGMKGSTTFQLTPEVAKVMGKANSAFVMKQHPEAIELFLEVVRQCPKSHEAYYSLALIYEELNDLKKSCSYYLIAAQLKNDDVDLWQHLGNLLIQNNQRNGAVYCLLKILKYQPDNIDCQFQLAELYWSLDMRVKTLKLLLDIYKKQLFDDELLHQIFQLGSQLNELLEVTKELEAVLTRSIMPFDNLTLLYFDVLSECYLMYHNFEKLENLLEGYGMHRFNENLPLKLNAMYIMSKLYLFKSQEASFLISQFSINPVDSNYLKVAKCCFDVHQFQDCVALLEKILYDPYLEHDKCPWYYRLGYCYYYLENYQMAVQIYQEGLKIEPFNAELLLGLAELYDKLQMKDQVLSILSQMGTLSAPKRDFLEDDDIYEPEESDEETFDMEDESQLVMKLSQTRKKIVKGKRGTRRAFLSIKKSRFDTEQCKQMRAMFQKAGFLHCQDPKDPRHLFFLKTASSIVVDFINNPLFFARNSANHTKKKKVESIASYFEKSLKNTPLDPEEADFVSSIYAQSNAKNATAEAIALRLSIQHGLEIEEWRTIVLQYGLALAGCKKYRAAVGFLIRCSCSNIISLNPKDFGFFKFLILSIAIRSNISSLICTSIRNIFQYNPSSDVISLYYIIGSCIPESFGQTNDLRGIKRYLNSNENNLQCTMFLAHMLSISRSYFECIAAHSRVLELTSSDPMAYFCAALSHLSYSMARTVINRHYQVIKAFILFQKYVELRGECQESWYNIGRACHHLGLFHLAIKHYEKALTFQPQHGLPDISITISYNLAQIYLRSGSEFLARQVISKHGILK